MVIGDGLFVDYSENSYAHAARQTGTRIVDTCSRSVCYAFQRSRSGGEYIPFVNAARILSRCMDMLAEPCDTVLQGIRHIRQEEFEQDSTYLYCPTMHKGHQSDIRGYPLVMRQAFR
jgi:hypothetical protein